MAEPLLSLKLLVCASAETLPFGTVAPRLCAACGVTVVWVSADSDPLVRQGYRPTCIPCVLAHTATDTAMTLEIPPYQEPLLVGLGMLGEMRRDAIMIGNGKLTAHQAIEKIARGKW